MGTEETGRRAGKGGDKAPDSRLPARQNKVKTQLVKKRRTFGVRGRESALASIVIEVPTNSSEIHLTSADQQYCWARHEKNLPSLDWIARGAPAPEAVMI
jgi:hypothetical protein